MAMPPGTVAVPEVGAAPLRRLTAREFHGTIADLIGDAALGTVPFPEPPAGEHGFEEAGPLSPLEVQLVLDMSDRVGDAVASRAGALASCAVKAGADERVCARDFIAGFGKRAYRRPLTTAEVADLEDLYQRARTELGLDVARSLGHVARALVISPAFLYHDLVGPDAAAGGTAPVKLGPFQVAARLSYFLWGSLPDADLFAAAEGNRLQTPADVAVQARRMLAARPRMESTLVDFHGQWLHLTDVGDLQKDGAVYPEFDESTRHAMQEELRRFLGDVVLAGEGTLGALLTASHSFVNGPLARIYGVAPPAAPTSFERRQLDGARRAGVLTQTAFLAVNGATNGSHPVKRGTVLWRQLLCGTVPEPPDEVPALADPVEGQTTRERFVSHLTPACAGCHNLLDPLGFAFEHYDGIGKWRALNAGKPVDASGTAVLPSGERSIPFDGAVKLIRELAATSDVRTCVAKNWFRYALGRLETPGEASVLGGIGRALDDSEGSLKELLVAIASSSSFLHRAPVAAERE